MPRARNSIPTTALAAARRHAESFGVVTARSLARAIAQLDYQAAERLAANLVAKGEWHRVAFTMNETRRNCFVPTAAMAGRGEIRRRLCLLHFCWELPQPRPPQDDAELATHLTKLAKSLRLDVPRGVPCYTHVANRRELKRFSLVHVCPAGAMQRTIRQLDELVSASAFTLWSHLAKPGAFALSCLWAGDPAEAAELSRWLRRRPPVSRIAGKNGVGAVVTPIPVWVYPIPRIVVARPSAGKSEDA